MQCPNQLPCPEEDTNPTGGHLHNNITAKPTCKARNTQALTFAWGRCWYFIRGYSVYYPHHFFLGCDCPPWHSATTLSIHALCAIEPKVRACGHSFRGVAQAALSIVSLSATV